MKLLEYCLSLGYNITNLNENKYSYNRKKVPEFQKSCNFVYLSVRKKPSWLNNSWKFRIHTFGIGEQDDSLQSMIDIDPLNWSLNSTSR